jgi:hypothetical protein
MSSLFPTDYGATPETYWIEKRCYIKYPIKWPDHGDAEGTSARNAYADGGEDDDDMYEDEPVTCAPPAIDVDAPPPRISSRRCAATLTRYFSCSRHCAAANHRAAR